MKWLQFRKKMFGDHATEIPLSFFELESLLEVQIEQADVSGTVTTLKRLGRQLFKEERITLVNCCIDKNMHAEAFFLARDLPPGTELKMLLDKIIQSAAFADDFNTSRAAALFSEQIHA